MEILPTKYQKYKTLPRLQQNDGNEQMCKALEISDELLILQARLCPIPNFEYIWPDGLFEKVFRNTHGKQNVQWRWRNLQSFNNRSANRFVVTGTELDSWKRWQMLIFV